MNTLNPKKAEKYNLEFATIMNVCYNKKHIRK